MPSVGTVVSYPIPLYANVVIEADFYEPSRFVITAISTGATTTVTTSVAHNYVIGQLVRLLIPRLYGAQQLNQQTGYVLSIPSTTQVVLAIDSSFANAFIANPLTATITNATQANPCVLTASNSFRTGNSIDISGVVGMTQLNGNRYQITTCTTSSITINTDSTAYTAYISDGTATLVTTDQQVPQIIAMGDINSGIISTSGNILPSTNVPGAFTNVSPQ